MIDSANPNCFSLYYAAIELIVGTKKLLTNIYSIGYKYGLNISKVI